MAKYVVFVLLSFLLIIISVLSTIFLIITAKIEEMENIRFFGEKYLDYRNKTSMFVPFLF